MHESEAGADLEVVQGVGLEDAEEGLLPLRKAELRVLREGAVDVARDDLIHLLLPDADLQQRVVAALLPILRADRPRHVHHRRHDPCTALAAPQHAQQCTQEQNTTIWSSRTAAR